MYLCGCFLNAAAEFCVVGSTGSCFSVATSATALGGAGALTPVLGRAATPTRTSAESSWRRPRSCRITAGAATDGGGRAARFSGAKAPRCSSRIGRGIKRIGASNIYIHLYYSPFCLAAAAGVAEAQARRGRTPRA